MQNSINWSNAEAHSALESANQYNYECVQVKIFWKFFFTPIAFCVAPYKNFKKQCDFQNCTFLGFFLEQYCDAPGQVLSLCCLVQYLPHKRVKYAYNYDHFNWYHYTYRTKYDYEQQKQQQQQLFSVRFMSALTNQSADVQYYSHYES